MPRDQHSACRGMTESDLEMILTWRNHPDVRRYMYTSHEIPHEEHVKWFNKASIDPRKHLLIYEYDGVPLGFVNITEIVLGRVADWGFYASPDAKVGSGKRMGEAALLYAFETVGIHKVCGQALGENYRSIRFHERLGFKREGVLRQQHFDGKNYIDVVCFGLLTSEYQDRVEE